MVPDADYVHLELTFNPFELTFFSELDRNRAGGSTPPNGKLSKLKSRASSSVSSCAWTANSSSRKPSGSHRMCGQPSRDAPGALPSRCAPRAYLDWIDAGDAHQRGHLLSIGHFREKGARRLTPGPAIQPGDVRSVRLAARGSWRRATPAARSESVRLLGLNHSVVIRSASLSLGSRASTSCEAAASVLRSRNSRMKLPLTPALSSRGEGTTAPRSAGRVGLVQKAGCRSPSPLGGESRRWGD